VPVAEYIAAIMADGPKAFWKLDDASGLPQDSSGNGLHLDTATGAAVTYQVPGPFGNFAIEFPATSTFTKATQVSTNVDNWTLECWFYLISIGANGRNIFSNDNTGVAGWGMQIDLTQKWEAFRDSVGLTPSRNALSVATWYQLVVRRVTSWQTFVNGVLDLDPAGAGTPATPNGPVQVHAGGSMSARMCMISIFEAGLTDAQILTHYQAANKGSVGPVGGSRHAAFGPF
jgi:hypothetical protein